MPNKNNQELSIEDFVQKQVSKWHSLYPDEAKKRKVEIPVITICMDPGAGGCLIAEQLAKRLDFDFFHRDIIHKISESARISTAVVESLEKERLSGVKDFISSLIKDTYIHPSIYLDHLMKVVGTIGKYGRAVVVGRGANFIMPPKDRYSVRIIAPLETRINNVAQRFGVASDMAKRRVLIRENRRRAFIRKSFNADICDPLFYDMVLNTEHMSIVAAVEAIIGAVMGCLGHEKKKS